MAISKNGRQYFTQAQYRVARSVTALEYAQRRGYDLVPCGHRFYLREHDSMVFFPDGRWFWNSRGLRGGALEFIRHYEGRSLPEAVLILNELDGMKVLAQADVFEKPSSDFSLPPRAADAGPLIDYLTRVRRLDADIVKELLEAGRIYLTRQRSGTVIHSNAVFVGFDAQGIPRSASLRGIAHGSSFKGDVSGSDKASPFAVPGIPGVDRLAIFESCIDAISHATMEKRQGLDWRRTERISQGGSATVGMLRKYIEDHPEIKLVLACYDNDPAGRKMETQLRQELADIKRIEILSNPPPCGKDWNDYLFLEAVTKK